jgi:ribonucleoside-diphosphate reductase alpha chain
MKQRYDAMKRNTWFSWSTDNEQEFENKFCDYKVNRPDGASEFLDIKRIKSTIEWAALEIAYTVDTRAILNETLKNLFDGVRTQQIFDALILATTGFIEKDPAYGYLAARLLFRKLANESIKELPYARDFQDATYRRCFVNGIERGVSAGLYDQRLGEFDLEYVATHLVPERDKLLDYMGMRTLYERYFSKIAGVRFELPQSFWLRVAMGLSYHEADKNEKAISFYNILSTLRYIPSTPTLLHSGLLRPQLSSCFLTTVSDDLIHIFKCLGDNAQLSKWSGGVANDWTPLRATGALIKTISMPSQGVIPFLKIANDVTAAISRSGSRRGATCVYLETWHLDIEEFLDLRRNTGDERRRTHDINTANWIPDLFMKRVIADAEWTLFSPHDTPDLHDLYGKAFEERYHVYEQMAKEGKIPLHKTISATELWRKMLSRLFETGHPWITFKDPSNIRSPQDHVGVVHSSNLCVEITLNTSATETAVCNLGSVNLARHITNGVLDEELLEQTVHTAIRMLDNVIDINFYPTVEAKNSNVRHRPIGLGQMGLQDALYKVNINFADPGALTFSDTTMEKISYYAIMASSQLAKERGAYQSYKGSKWDRNIFPADTIDLLERERGLPINVARTSTLDWSPVRAHVAQYGMRNSNVMAIAPTATISNIAGSFPCIEPIYKNIYVKSNMVGEFTVVNQYLIADLKELGMWDQEMLDQLKYYDGSVQFIDRIPQRLKDKYKEVFEIDPLWLIHIAAHRGRWIDQSQSLNTFLKGVSGKQLNDIYLASWHAGLKTNYYLRTLGATQIEKSTLDAKKFGYTQKREYTAVKSDRETHEDVVQLAEQDASSAAASACLLSQDPECEACQ